MFGEEYLKTRQRLADVVFRVLKLAEITGAERAPLMDDVITKDLSKPFLFMVCGEINAGKSTLLNGLFGHEICESTDRSEPDRVRCYRYGEERHDKEMTPILEERFRPIESLMDFNLVDPPGTNAMTREHQAVADRFLSTSDLVFWVFPASNPWGASTWNGISRLDQSTLDKSIFIVQQADEHDEKDMEVILGHMRDLCVQRVGHRLPIYPVSGMSALQAKMESPMDARRWRQSGFPLLEQDVSDRVAHSPVRRDGLHRIRDAVGEVLRRIEEMIDLRRRLLNENEGFLREIETEVAEECEKQSSDLPVKLTRMRDVFSSQSEKVKGLMYRKMNVWASMRSLFVAERIPKAVEAALVDSVKAAMAQQANDEGKQLVDACRKHWETVRPRVKERLAISLRDMETAGFDPTCERFSKRMARAARLAVLNLNLRGGLDHQLAERRAGLKARLYVCLVLLLASGVAGSLAVSPDPYVALGLLAGSMSSVLIFAYHSRRTRNEIIQSLSEKLDDSRIPFADALEGDYKEGVHDFYIEYGGLLGSVRRHIADAELELQPNLRQWNGLFLELKEIEQGL
ncbi:MAG: 50S ribosome-binding GTPase [Verrucomicrobiae bacterium]|nr:50S ribosome-binding GTPase [Verrucomicrobiae bacterium]NNJ43139.1 hypothetical protein [Akkermansiaceae bacterium]